MGFSCRYVIGNHWRIHVNAVFGKNFCQIIGSCTPLGLTPPCPRLGNPGSPTGNARQANHSVKVHSAALKLLSSISG